MYADKSNLRNLNFPNEDHANASPSLSVLIPEIRGQTAFFKQKKAVGAALCHRSP